MQDLKPEEINNVVVECIAKSMIGLKIKEQIEDAVEDLAKNTYNPVKPIIRDEIYKVIKTELKSSKYRTIIREFVEEKITDDMIKTLLESLWSTWRREIG